MNSESSMFSRTFKANPYSIRHTNPLRIVSPALETRLKKQNIHHFDRIFYMEDSYIFNKHVCHAYLYSYIVSIFWFEFF